VSRSTTPAFDLHAADYASELMKGLKLAGESKDYFAQGRIDYLREWWDAGHRREPRRILDVGCGIGDVTVILAGTFPEAEVIGLDPSPKCLERAIEDYAGERVSFRPLERVISPQADLIHLNGVVHHIEPAEREAFFHALAAAVAPGGALALFENNPLNPGTHLVMARIPFDRGCVKVPHWEARRRLRESGLDPSETGFLFYFPRALAWLRPLERRLQRLPLGAQYGVLATRKGRGQTAS
jgi:SAM-dependent methyltransferase